MGYDWIRISRTLIQKGRPSGIAMRDCQDQQLLVRLPDCAARVLEEHFQNISKIDQPGWRICWFSRSCSEM